MVNTVTWVSVFPLSTREAAISSAAECGYPSTRSRSKAGMSISIIVASGKDYIEKLPVIILPDGRKFKVLTVQLHLWFQGDNDSQKFYQCKIIGNGIGNGC